MSVGLGSMGLSGLPNLFQPPPPKTPLGKAQDAVSSFTKPFDDSVEPILKLCHPWATMLAACLIVSKVAGTYALNMFLAGFFVGSWMTLISYVPPSLRSWTSGLGYLYGAAAIGIILGSLLVNTFLGFWFLPLAIASNMVAAGRSGTVALSTVAVCAGVWMYFKYQGVPLEERMVEILSPENVTVNAAASNVGMTMKK